MSHRIDLAILTHQLAANMLAVSMLSPLEQVLIASEIRRHFDNRGELNKLSDQLELFVERISDNPQAAAKSASRALDAIFRAQQSPEDRKMTLRGIKNGFNLRWAQHRAFLEELRNELVLETQPRESSEL